MCQFVSEYSRSVIIVVCHNMPQISAFHASSPQHYNIRVVCSCVAWVSTEFLFIKKSRNQIIYCWYKKMREDLFVFCCRDDDKFTSSLMSESQTYICVMNWGFDWMRKRVSYTVVTCNKYEGLDKTYDYYNDSINFTTVYGVISLPVVIIQPLTFLTIDTVQGVRHTVGNVYTYPDFISFPMTFS